MSSGWIGDAVGERVRGGQHQLIRPVSIHIKKGPGVLWYGIQTWGLAGIGILEIAAMCRVDSGGIVQKKIKFNR